MSPKKKKKKPPPHENSIINNNNLTGVKNWASDDTINTKIILYCNTVAMIDYYF